MTEAAASPSTARCSLGGAVVKGEVPAGATEWIFKDVLLAAGPSRLEAWLERGGEKVGVTYVDVMSLQ